MTAAGLTDGLLPVWMLHRVSGDEVVEQQTRQNKWTTVWA